MFLVVTAMNQESRFKACQCLAGKAGGQFLQWRGVGERTDVLLGVDLVFLVEWLASKPPDPIYFPCLTQYGDRSRSIRLVFSKDRVIFVAEAVVEKRGLQYSFVIHFWHASYCIRLHMPACFSNTYAKIICNELIIPRRYIIVVIVNTFLLRLSKFIHTH